MTKENRRIWLYVLLSLGVLFPGFPVLMILIGLPLSMIGLDGPVFKTALFMHNHYYALPAAVFSCGDFPSEEFGYLPTAVGYALAVELYAGIAAVLSIPIAWAICVYRQKKTRP